MPFRPVFALVACLLAPLAWADPPPEVQLAMQSLRPAEKDKLFKALGPLDELPLYRADLEVDAEKRTVTGKIVITVVPRDKPLPWLELRVPPNASDKTRVKLSHASANGKPTLIEQPEPSLYRVKFDEAAPKGLAMNVELHVAATVPQAPEGSTTLAGGLGAQSARTADHGAFMAAGEVINLAGLVPGMVPLVNGNPMAGPSGIGDLALFEPAHYLVTVLAPRGWAVVAGGTPLGEVPEKDGRTRYAFGLSAARDFGLFVTKGYEVESSVVDGVTVESHFLPADKEAGKRALKYAVSALTEFQKRLGPYPWTTLRVVQTRLSAGAGGMEFPALITVSTGIYRGATDPLAALGLPGLGDLPMLQAMLGDLKPMMESTLEFTVAHEVAHQWFPMMVGSDPIDEPVVDEALAQEMALLYLEWKRGRGTADHMREAQLKLAYQFHRMSGGGDGKALRSTREFSTVGEYAALVYGKAPLLFDNQRKLTGDAVFIAGLKSYAEVFRWRWVKPVSFTELLGKKAPKHAKALEGLRKRYWEEEHGDEDVGLNGMFTGLTGINPGKGTPMNEETRKMIEEAIKMLQGQGQGQDQTQPEEEE